MKKILIIPFALLLMIACDSKKKVESSEVETLDEELNQAEEGAVDIVENQMEGAETPEEAAESPEEVLLENDYVKAYRVQLEPGKALPWHKGGDRVIYPLNTMQIKMNKFADDENAVEKLLKKDVPHWHQENIHSITNIGNTTADYLVVIRKSKRFPEGEMYGKSELKEAENLNETLLFENPSVRVAKTSLAAGEKTPMHKGIYRLSYAMTDYSLSYEKENQEAEIRNLYAGNAHWHLPSNHSLENVSNEGVADFVLFEFKE